MRECLSFFETVAAAMVGVILAELLLWTIRALVFPPDKEEPL